MTSTSNLQPPTFIGKHYELCSLTMKVLFWGQYVWEIVDNGYVEPTNQGMYNALTQVENDALKYQRKKDGKEMFCIHQAMHESTLPSISKASQGILGHTSNFLSRYGQSQKNLKKSTQRLEKEIISDNKPLRGGNLLLPHLNVQVQDDSK
jgi:hypothetical protein